MTFKDIFTGIQDFTETILFAPFDALRSLELDSWFLASVMNWLFMIVGFVAFIYWMRELKTYNENDEEDRSSTSHSYLG
ncbi:DUF6341 family protein [Cochleicola gelatinilyticus]|uniref:Uracil phosphoribosyltransferase n=1 Tax=Cochleicola gelatinilyticus TaxID=1763537 RepID=A0A167J0Y2_9FLAO|nr:uracil phosphoribosyltransferase [Cochleicola gelatinilyticus]OAB80213.1 uracil phosphoribosyltransferase [Cochleicola gelatinilyticus]